jgi:hypothetical protein
VSRHDRLCCALCYALLGALTWAVFTHDPLPMLALAVVSLGVAYWPEWVKR